jgi:uncharacterized integral membrane protein
MPGLFGWARSSSRKERGPTMGTSISSSLETLVTVVLIAMFVIVFVVARGALKQMPLFGDVGSWPVALCTAVLAVMGLLRFLGPPDPSTYTERTPTGGIFDFILLPYATLAIALLLVLLLLALGKLRASKNQTPWKQQRVELPSEVKMRMRPRQTKPQESLRDRLEK